MSQVSDYLNLSEKRRLEELASDYIELKRRVYAITAERRIINRRAAARRDAANAATGARV